MKREEQEEIPFLNLSRSDLHPRILIWLFIYLVRLCGETSQICSRNISSLAPCRWYLLVAWYDDYLTNLNINFTKRSAVIWNAKLVFFSNC